MSKEKNQHTDNANGGFGTKALSERQPEVLKANKLQGNSEGKAKPPIKSGAR